MSIHKSSITVPKPGFLGGGSWEIEKTNHVNVLVGLNGSGKSLLLRAMRDLNANDYHYIVPERAGQLSFSAGLIAEVSNAGSRGSRSRQNFAPSYREEVVTRLHGYYVNRGSKPKKEINHDPESLFKNFQILLPDFTVRPRVDNPYYDLRRLRDDSVCSSIEELSSGEAQLVSLGIDLITIVGIWELEKQSIRAILIDEPDAHIHPDLQIRLAQFLIALQQEYGLQIFVATNSTTLMSALGMFASAQASIFVITPETTKVTGHQFNRVAKEISSILGGHLLMGPLFGKPFLLVEGDDDYHVWLRAARSQSSGFVVLPCNGEEIKKYRLTLERIFTAFAGTNDPKGFAIIDGDKALPKATPQNPQKFVPFKRLNCHEAENLYFTETVLQSLGHDDWASALATIESAVKKSPTKFSRLKDIKKLDRRNGDVKPIINDVARILDPSLEWFVRLGKTVGSGKPVGELREYLGDDIVDSIWA